MSDHNPGWDSTVKPESLVKVRTVLGDIALDHLGCTLMHEHIFWDFDPKWREKSIDYSRRELNRLIPAGVSTVVDVAPHPYRIMEWYQALASQVKIHLIVSTGFYLERRTSQEFWDYSESQMVDRFLKELTKGIGNTPLKAGVIKVAAEKAQLTPWEQRVFRAAAWAQRETGVAICTHAIEGAQVQFRALTEAGADPERIYISHTETEAGWEGRSVSEQIGYLHPIVRNGGSLYFSNFGWDFLSQEDNIKNLLLILWEQGFQNRVLFSADANYKIDADGNTWWEEQGNHPELPAKNFAYTFTYTVPLLKSWGFSEPDLNLCLVENPKRMFSTATPG